MLPGSGGGGAGRCPRGGALGRDYSKQTGQRGDRAGAEKMPQPEIGHVHHERRSDLSGAKFSRISQVAAASRRIEQSPDGSATLCLTHAGGA